MLYTISMKKLLATLIIATLLIVGLFLPLGSYTTQSDTCPTGDGPIETRRLRLITGGSLQEIRDQDKSFKSVGNLRSCKLPQKYILYIL